VSADFDNECFFIAPIGEDDSEIRKRSDAVRDWVVKPAAESAVGLRTVRADEVGEPGQITSQAVQHCLKAKAAVADLTGGNPNVYYELSVRHGALMPVVLIAENDTKLPFDISQSRVIFFDHRDLDSAGKAREELRGQIEASLSSPPDNPISDGMRLAELQAGNVEEQTLGMVLDRLQRLANMTEHVDERLRRWEAGEVSSRDRRRRGVIQPLGRRTRQPGEVPGLTLRDDSPFEIEEVLGSEAFDLLTDAKLTPGERAMIVQEARERNQAKRTPSSEDSNASQVEEDH